MVRKTVKRSSTPGTRSAQTSEIEKTNPIPAPEADVSVAETAQLPVAETVQLLLVKVGKYLLDHPGKVSSGDFVRLLQANKQNEPNLRRYPEMRWVDPDWMTEGEVPEP